MPYVYSTLTCNNEYADYVKVGDQLNVQHKVLIKGGHGVMNKNFMTPLGVVTEVSDDDLRFLMNNSAFKFHLEGNFVKVEEKAYEPEKVAADMERADNSAQITPADYEPGGKLFVEGMKVDTKKTK